MMVCSPKEAMLRRMLVTLLTLLFYYYPSILTTTLSLYTCYRLDRQTAAVKYWHNARVRFYGNGPASFQLHLHHSLGYPELMPCCLTLDDRFVSYPDPNAMSIG